VAFAFTPAPCHPSLSAWWVFFLVGRWKQQLRLLVPELAQLMFPELDVLQHELDPVAFEVRTHVSLHDSYHIRCGCAGAP
jgi:hypothetical protein